MKTNIVINISPKIPCLVKIWFSGYESDCCWPIKLQDPLKCNISRKNLVMKYIFDMQINVESFFKLILSIGQARHVQNTQNKKFPNLSNISRETSRMNLIFRMEINTSVFFKLMVSLWLCVSQACLKYPE